MAKTKDGYIVVEGEPVWVLGKPEYGFTEYEFYQFFVGKGLHLVDEEGSLTVYKVAESYNCRVNALEDALQEANDTVEYLTKRLAVEKL